MLAGRHIPQKWHKLCLSAQRHMTLSNVQTSLFTLVLSCSLYGICSTSLLLLNKNLTIVLKPASIMAYQTLGSICVLFLVKLFGLTLFSLDFGGNHGGNLHDKDTLKRYSSYSILWLLGIYTNIKALEVGRVNTVILVRSSTPILVSLIEFLTGRSGIPTKRGCVSMLMMLVGGFLYVRKDLSAGPEYFWNMLYYVAISCEAIWGKVRQSQSREERKTTTRRT